MIPHSFLWLLKQTTKPQTGQLQTMGIGFSPSSGDHKSDIQVWAGLCSLRRLHGRGRLSLPASRGSSGPPGLVAASWQSLPCRHGAGLPLLQGPIQGPDTLSPSVLREPSDPLGPGVLARDGLSPSPWTEARHLGCYARCSVGCLEGHLVSELISAVPRQWSPDKEAV